MEAPVDEVRGGGTGGVDAVEGGSLSELWISLAWLVVEQEERVDEDPWGAPRLSSSQERVPVRRGGGGSSSPSLRIPELHSSLTLSDSLAPVMSANSSTKMWV